MATHPAARLARVTSLRREIPIRSKVEDLHVLANVPRGDVLCSESVFDSRGELVAKKVTRKELLKEPDEFISTSAKVVDIIRENQRSVDDWVVVFLICVLAAAGLYGRNQYRTIEKPRAFQQGIP